MKVRLFKPCVGEEEMAAIREIFDISWLGLGGKVGELEQEWSRFIGCRESVGVNSATAALHLGLAAFRFPEGKKVLTPAMTFASTAMASHYNRLEPVFVDCREDTLGMDLEDLERKIDRDCVAIMPVHFGGHPVFMDQLMEIANRHGLKVIEDCAHTQGGEYLGRKLGTWGHVGCFSFEEKKGMTTGDGGMICSDDTDLLAPLRAARWVGIDKDTWKREIGSEAEKREARHWFYEIRDIGYKYNMNNLAACIGLAQLKKLDWMNQAKRRALARYLEGIQGLDGIEPLLPYDLNTNSSYWIFAIKARERDRLMVHLTERGIATGLHYTPLPLQPFWRHHTEPIPTALRLYGQMLTLPLFPEITPEEVDYVVEALRTFR
jgi:perosamine synthetase